MCKMRVCLVLLSRSGALFPSEKSVYSGRMLPETLFFGQITPWSRKGRRSRSPDHTFPYIALLKGFFLKLLFI